MGAAVVAVDGDRPDYRVGVIVRGPPPDVGGLVVGILGGNSPGRVQFITGPLRHGGLGREGKCVSRARLIAYGVITVLLVLYFTPAPALGLGRGPAVVSLSGQVDVGEGETPVLLAGASKVDITPYHAVGPAAGRIVPPGVVPVDNRDPEWTGPVTHTGLWGEDYVDGNMNGRYDVGEPFTDDERNTALDPGSAGKWDGIYLAGFGNDRPATGVYDPIWVRTIVLRSGPVTLAWAVLDTVACSSAQVPRIRDFLTDYAPDLEVDVILLTATHNHEGPDTVGLWGPSEFTDGKFPLYLEYIDLKVAQSIALAARDLVPVTVTCGQVTPETYPDLAGLQCRNSLRTPWFFDDELRVMGLANAETGEQVATLVNWGTHVESLEGDNTCVSSDFTHSLREVVEEALGGIAVYAPADQGAVEIVGDSGTRVWRREVFDGEVFPVDPETGKPLEFSLARTRAIGRVVGKAALAALEGGAPDPTATYLELSYKDIYIPLTNQLFRLAGILGVLDMDLYVADRWKAGPFLGNSVKTTVYAFRIGEGSFTTAPGELFPEINFGLGEHHRADFAATATGRPFEPCIRDAQPGTYKFLIGYTPDLLGYIVPSYDFYIYGLPAVSGVGIGAVVGEVTDPNADVPPDPAYPDARYVHHYQETNSASSLLAPAVACTAVELWGVDLTGHPSYEEWMGAKTALLLLPNPFRNLRLDLDELWVEHQ